MKTKKVYICKHYNPIMIRDTFQVGYCNGSGGRTAVGEYTTLETAKKIAEKLLNA